MHTHNTNLSAYVLLDVPDQLTNSFINFTVCLETSGSFKHFPSIKPKLNNELLMP